MEKTKFCKYTLLRCLLASISCISSWTQTETIPPYFGIDFHTAMEHTEIYRRSLVTENPGWRIIKEKYDHSIVKNLEYSPEPRIPKIIHQIWVGSPFPEKYKKLQQTWIQKNPDWKYILWTEKEILEFGLQNSEQYKATNNYGIKSDIARYEILYRIGGLYIDTDFECLKPFDIFHHCCDFYSGCGFGHCFEVFNGLIGSKPGHPILAYAINEISHKKNLNGDPLASTGPYFWGNCCAKTIPSCGDRAVIFPITYFYPWPHWKRQANTRAQIEQWFKPETYAVHHWHVSWR